MFFSSPILSSSHESSLSFLCFPVGKVCIKGGEAEEKHIRNPHCVVDRERFCSWWYEIVVWEDERRLWKS